MSWKMFGFGEPLIFDAGRYSALPTPEKCYKILNRKQRS